MDIVFRTDASEKIGTGHVVRCLTLADRLAARGARCIFAMREHPGHLGDRVAAKGYQVRYLKTDDRSGKPAGDYGDWLGVSQDEDARQTRDAIAGNADWIVVDHYSLDARWQAELRGSCGKIAVIDDLANRPHDCDLLLDQNYFRRGAQRYDALVSAECRILTGPAFALLQPEYALERRRLGERRFPSERLLVFYGGADVTDETSRALRVLSQPPFSGLKVDVVAGASSRNRDNVKRLCDRRPHTALHQGLTSLAPIMRAADLALGAGGTTSWERCALGLPAIVTTVADNQRAVAAELAAEGLIVLAGDWENIDDASLAQTLERTLNDRSALERLSRQSLTMTDALGAERVAECLLPTALREMDLKPAGPEHKALYFAWANDPAVRQSAFNSAPIPWQQHDAWYDRKLSDPDCHMWIMQTPGNLPLGQIRLDRDRNEHLIDFSVDRLARGRGLGAAMLLGMLRSIVGLDEIVQVRGEVKAENGASLGAFRKSGAFTESHDQSRDVFVFNWNRER
jgi:UDP-2,4-diacetamido-2,4,6-trideoxy-beta-L-altropyranose hydrolase